MHTKHTPCQVVAHPSHIIKAEEMVYVLTEVKYKKHPVDSAELISEVKELTHLSQPVTHMNQV